MRVSTPEQAAEGHSGIIRQVQHIHEVAQERGLSITWDRCYADDSSGFEWKNRESLRTLLKTAKGTVVSESLDCLSRNADWQQGYLLNEFKEKGVQVLFWKAIGSRIERAVQGAIAQEGMEDQKAKMKGRTLDKAKDGRITSKRPRYGFKFVDDNGQETSRARRMTYYAIKEDEALVIRFILQGITSGAYALRSMAEECQKRFPRKNGVSWSHTHISGIITHPIYKGEFIANRLMKVKDENGKKRDVERPRDEWISVPVPAIVTPELWEQANRMLEMNKRTAPRNSKNEYLLTGLLICASCGYHWHGHIAIYKYKRKDGTRHAYKTPLYYCNSTNMLPHKRKQVACDQRKISCNVLDRAVWEIVSDVLTEPQYMLDALDRSLTSDINKEIEAQIDYIDRQFADKKREEEKLWAAYNADVFDVEEYQERLRLIKQGRETLKLERTALERKLITPEAVEAQKAMILNLCETAIVAGKLEDVPFEVKRQIIKLVVDEVVVDVRERTFELRGTLSGKFSIVSKSTAIPCPAP